MKKTISSLLAIFVAWVSISAIDCGCSFSQTHQRISESIEKVSTCGNCPSEEEIVQKNVRKEKEDCCSGCKLEKKSQPPLNFLPTLSTLLENKRNDDYSLNFSSKALRKKNSFRDCVCIDTGELCPIVVDVPTYLANEVFLI